MIHLSVVVPVYNGEAFIEETIESFLRHADGYPAECIVVDDGSLDQTLKIVNGYSDKIRIYQQENAGEGSAVNKGLNEAYGDFVVVVSADDPVLTSELFSGVIEFFKYNPEIVAWYPNWNIIDENNHVRRTVKLPAYDFKDLFSRNKVLPGPGTWFRLEHALSIGGRNPKWKYVGDYDFWLRLSMKGKLAHRDAVVAQWRSHTGSTSIAERGSRMSKERIQVIDDFIIANQGKLDRTNVSLARAHAHYLAAKLGFFSLEVNSRKLLFESLRLNPMVLLSAKPHEIIFMIFFPFSKYLVNFAKRITI
jgi:glycosyltransferase involved in cell wall biosynthesis